ncbi:MAG TPA: alpha/beta fold hydrolase [Blastocatellia bacterium]|jgi:predicted alpha/beta-fold hydrolase|nr:alpha/beta fold hydrolase [Blastocatellia bacterium]
MSTGQLALNSTGQIAIKPQATAPASPSPRWTGTIAGHFWTITSPLRAAILPTAAPASRHFEVTVEDSTIGPVRISGLLADSPKSDTLVLIVHGLAGSANSWYCASAARAAEQAGYSSLRLSMRGADGSGEDIYHGGLTEDLKAALASPELARYRRIFLLGYSFGGHIVLRAAIEQVDPRIHALAAICPPLDLKATMESCDAPSRRIYRRCINSSLNANYAKTAARRDLPTPVKVLKRARKCGEWNAAAIVPRFGFNSLEDYYHCASVSTDIRRLQTPSFIVASLNDPIVEPETLLPTLDDAPPVLKVCWVRRGGHVCFPARLDLGQGGALGLEAQIMRWLSKH